MNHIADVSETKRSRFSAVPARPAFSHTLSALSNRPAHLYRCTQPGTDHSATLAGWVIALVSESRDRERPAEHEGENMRGRTEERRIR